MPEDYTDEEISDGLLDFYEDALSNGHFGDVDKCLSDLAVSKCSTVDLLLIATITYHGKQHLTTRDNFITQLEEEFIKRLGYERAMRLLEYRR